MLKVGKSLATLRTKNFCFYEKQCIIATERLISKLFSRLLAHQKTYLSIQVKLNFFNFSDLVIESLC